MKDSVEPLLECPICPAVWQRVTMPDREIEFAIPMHNRVQYNLDFPILCAGSMLQAKLTYFDEQENII